jgi:hypothetical protein
LRSDEHVHHLSSATMTCADVRQLEIWLAEAHGELHVKRRDWWLTKMWPLWKPRDAQGRFTKFPTNESVERERACPVPF